MKILRQIVFFLFVAILMTACHASYYGVKIAKPKKHFLPFDAAKDSKKKRVKTVRYRSLKKTKGISAKE